jgi:hypothetical protein
MDGRSFRLFTLSTVIGMLFVLALALAGRSPAAMAQPAAEGGPMEVVAGGLDNPRHMTFGPDGALYVAEAGSGGAGPCAPGPEGGDICIGESGAVTRIKDGMQERVVDDLVSLAGEAAADSATGPHDVAFTGEGDLRVIIGLGADPNSRGDSGPFGALSDNLGQLVAVDANGDWMNEVDVSAHEATDNPDGGALDSNPYALLAVEDGYVVADAGANALLHVAGDGTVTTLAVFPDTMVEFPPGSGQMMPMQAVPTSVAQAGDGSFYVGQLTGFPFPPGGASVWKVPAGGGDPELYAEGFTNIIDLAMDGEGMLYVLEIDADSLFTPAGPGMNGRLVRLDGEGGQDTWTTCSPLPMPGGVEIGPDGDVYVSIWSVLSDAGQVVRLGTDEQWCLFQPVAAR